MTAHITQSVDLFAVSFDALSFTLDDEALTILPNVAVTSVDGRAVVSARTHSDLINFGNLLSGSPADVELAGVGSVVTNMASGLISGLGAGVVMAAPGRQSVFNEGKIIGAASYGIYFAGANLAVVNNQGYVSGGVAGILNQSISGATFTNSGVIKSAGVGIELFAATTKPAIIDNATGGVIEGLTAGVEGTNGAAFSLVNHGTVIGAIDDASGVRDVIVNRGAIRGAVDLGAGNDLFDGAGGTSGAIFAGSGNDRIIGGSGKVVIHLGSGNDTVTAGPGTDRFIFETAPGAAIDKISQFKPGIDKIVLSAADFAGIGPVGHALAAADLRVGGHAATATQEILYNPANGFLSYDPDGNGAMAPVHFATLAAHLALHNTDFLVVA